MATPHLARARQQINRALAPVRYDGHHRELMMPASDEGLLISVVGDVPESDDPDRLMLDLRISKLDRSDDFTGQFLPFTSLAGVSDARLLLNGRPYGEPVSVWTNTPSEMRAHFNVPNQLGDGNTYSFELVKASPCYSAV